MTNAICVSVDTSLKEPHHQRRVHDLRGACAGADHRVGPPDRPGAGRV